VQWPKNFCCGEETVGGSTQPLAEGADVFTGIRMSRGHLIQDVRVCRFAEDHIAFDIVSELMDQNSALYPGICRRRSTTSRLFPQQQHPLAITY
jgi:hypothetical protein